jgi:hypothetical protein
MTDAPEPREAPAPWPQDWRIGVSVGVLVLCFIAIAYLIGWGSPTNSLHESALAWAFSLVLGILVINGITVMIAPSKVITNLTSRKE